MYFSPKSSYIFAIKSHLTAVSAIMIHLYTTGIDQPSTYEPRDLYHVTILDTTNTLRYIFTTQSKVLGPILVKIIPSIFKFDKNFVLSYPNSIKVIAANFCTCHASCTGVACAKGCSDRMTKPGITAKRIFHRIWIMMKNIISEMCPCSTKINTGTHDDVIRWNHFPRNWPFVRGIHRSPVNSPHKGQWRGALMFSLICVWINDWVNNREAGDLRRYRAHYDVIVMIYHLNSR